MQVINSLMKRISDENGSTIVEASFIFPIVLVILFFLMFLSNAFYTKAKIDSIVMSAAIEGASKCGNLLLTQIEENGEVPDLNAFEKNGGAKPYRYIVPSNGKIVDNINKAVYKQITDKSISFFPGYEPTIITAENKISKYNNYILYSTFSVQVEYEIEFKILSFIGDIPPLKLYSYSTEPVNDASELIRNMDMLDDYIFKEGGLAGKLSSQFSKVQNFIDKLFGEK